MRMGFSRWLGLSGKLIYPFFSVVAVFMMLIRILNTLPSRIWDVLFFLFSDYSKSTVGEKGLQKVRAFREINLSLLLCSRCI